jgi:hypothetical protein
VKKEEMEIVRVIIVEIIKDRIVKKINKGSKEKNWIKRKK